MAIHKPTFGPVATQVIEDMFDPEVQKEHVPGVADIAEGAALLRNMHNEIGVVGQFQKSTGFVPGLNMQRVAKFNTAQQIALEHLHEVICTCSRPIWGVEGHKEWFYEFLSKHGQTWDVRTKLV